MDRDEIISKAPLIAELTHRGVEVNGKGMARCPFHDDKNPSMSVSGDVWNCHACNIGGSVIDLVMQFESCDAGAAMRYLTERAEGGQSQPNPRAKPTISKTYDYTDELGNMLYQVVRLEPKSFRQRHKNQSGEWVWSMTDVRRVPYNLPAVMGAESVWIVEGEKDANMLGELGHVATCNVGGAGKWLDGYSEFLRDKDIVLCGDSDDVGKEHAKAVLESLAGKVKSVRVIHLPPEYKDISDYIDDHADKVEQLVDGGRLITGGIDIPVYSMDELEQQYVEFLAHASENCVHMNKWLPSLGANFRALVPGDMVTIIAGTGVGKSMVLQNIAAKIDLPVLFFEIELPAASMFERAVALDSGQTQSEVEKRYRDGARVAFPHSKNVYTCPLSRLGTKDIEKIIGKSELKIGRKPAVVMVDYIGLMAGKGSGRYERLSTIAEELKVIAKACGVVLFIASQVKRGGDEEVHLHDAKDSGSIENSSSLVLGLWQDEDGCVLKVKVLKCTKGTPGKVIVCNMDGARVRITERVTGSSAQMDARHR